MSDATRRNFLIATGAGAAAAGVAAAIPVSASASANSSAQKPLTKPADAEPLVAHISDPDTGEVCLLVGNREVVVHDHDLVARLTRAASPLFRQGV